MLVSKTSAASKILPCDILDFWVRSATPCKVLPGKEVLFAALLPLLLPKVFWVMGHRLQWFIQLRAHGPRNEGEQPA